MSEAFSALFRPKSGEQIGPRTTLKLGGPAEYFTRVERREELVRALKWARERALPVRILGGGSNLIVADAGVKGLVVEIGLRGVEASAAGGAVRVKAQAGEPWDAFVARTVVEDWTGLECLSGIPGRVGATPIQNVGAYGQEVSEVIEAVEVLDRETLQIQTLQPKACEFGYRDSFFKRNPHRFIVLSVTFRLNPGGAPTIRYAELARTIGEDRSLAHVREVVLGLRRSKSMVIDAADPNHRSAGSFFTNPIVDAATFADVQERALKTGSLEDINALPNWPVAGGTKLAAGWLIEKSGVQKGLCRGGVGVSTNHALCLINRGGGSTRELMALASEIQDRVREAFGVGLVPEPVRWEE